MPNEGDEIARINADGTVLDVVTVLNAELPLEAFAPEGGSAVPWPAGTTLPAYRKDGAFLPLPARPSEHSNWDLVTETWVDQRTPAQITEAFRATLVCTPLQGRLVLGAAECARLDAYLAEPTTPWAIKEIATKSMEWRRASENMDLLGYLMGYTPEQMDALFVAAMKVQA